MTVEQLIEKLKEYNPKLKVWMAEDPEGNDFRPIDDFGIDEVDGSQDYVLVLWPGYYVRN